MPPPERKPSKSLNPPPSPLGRIISHGILHKEDSYMLRSDYRTFGVYALMYILSGTGRYEDTRGLRCTIKEGDLILVFPHLPHRYGPGPGEKWSEIFIVFEGPVFQLWEKHGWIHESHPILHAEPVGYWQKKLQAVIDAHCSHSVDPRLSHVDISLLQWTLSQMLFGSQSRKGNVEDEKWVLKARTMIESDLTCQHSMQKVAQWMGITYSNFRKRFTRLTGTPPNRHHTHCVMNQACELFKKGFNAKTIAKDLGFHDEFHFSRRFKQIIGISPKHFRSRL